MIEPSIAALVALSLLLGVPDPRTEEARQAFDLGVQALDRGDAAQAVELFERSIALRDSQPALFNLGLAYMRLDQSTKAISVLRRFTANAEPGQPGARRAALLIEQLEERVARVTLEIVGQPDLVAVDGEETALEDGVHDLTLDAGRHELRVEKRGFAPDVRRVVLAPKSHVQVVLDASRHADPARLLVTVDRSAAEIRLDHLPIGRGRFDGQVSAGAHWLEVTDQGYVPARRRLSLSPGSIERVDVALVEMEQETVVTKWWFWTAVGVAAAAVAGGATVAVLATRPRPDGGTEGLVLFD